jgi:hypothetical protein
MTTVTQFSWIQNPTALFQLKSMNRALGLRLRRRRRLPQHSLSYQEMTDEFPHLLCGKGAVRQQLFIMDEVSF